jgi:hypothetical protein
MVGFSLGQYGHLIGWLVQGEVSKHAAAFAIENLIKLGHELDVMLMAILPLRPVAFLRMILQSGAGRRHSPHGSALQSTEEL